MDYFSKIKEENGIKVIEIGEFDDKYELLAMIFHNPTLQVDINNSFVISKNDSKRYFEDTTVCFNCGEVGHISRNCKIIDERNCMYCDLKHIKQPCSFILCENCKYLGHHTRFCRGRQYHPQICLECPLQHHYTDECPKVWRVYKFKNYPNKKAIIMSCPHCQGEDHFLDDCTLNDRKFSIFTKNYMEVARKVKKSKK